jgi:hypothetical protein
VSHFILDLRERASGGAVKSGSLYLWLDNAEVPWDGNLPDFTTLTRGTRVVVLLHGYNVDRAEGRTSLTRYMAFLEKKGITGPMLSVLWPGDGWAKALTYPFEGRDADDSADALFRWLCNFVDPTARVAFVAHSLGCRVAMQTSKQLSVRTGAAGPALDRVCLMAGAIDNDSLGKAAKFCFREGTLASEHVAVLASLDDEVLRYAYPLGDLAQTILFGERYGRALGRTGPDERDTAVTAKIGPALQAGVNDNVDHGDYLAAQQPPPGAPIERTIASTEEFVAAFLMGKANPVWPAMQ